MRIKKALIISISAILLTAIIGTGVYTMTRKMPMDMIPEFNTSQYSKSEDELTVYDYNSFISCHGSRDFASPYFSSTSFSLTTFNNAFPVELIKKIDKNHICVVYKLSHEKAGDMLAYVVFERDEKKDFSSGLEGWGRATETYFLTKYLSSTDFDSIKVGTPALDVYNIEPAIAAEMNNQYLSFKFDDSYIYFTSYRLLTDGIMLIEFKTQRNNSINDTIISECTVSSKTFYPYKSEAVQQVETMINAPDILK